MTPDLWDTFRIRTKTCSFCATAAMVRVHGHQIAMVFPLGVVNKCVEHSLCAEHAALAYKAGVLKGWASRFDTLYIDENIPPN